MVLIFFENEIGLLQNFSSAVLKFGEGGCKILYDVSRILEILRTLAMAHS